MEWFLMALRKFAQFGGRSRRKEYWMYTLFVVIISTVLSLADNLVGIRTANGTGGVGVLSGLFSLATFVPSLAVSVRRLHDTGRSGLWLLLVLVPVIGWLVLLYFTVQEGEPGENRYGPDPKGAASLAFA